MKASLNTDVAVDPVVDIPEFLRRFKSHKRNLDSQVTTVIRSDENVEKDLQRKASVSPYKAQADSYRFAGVETARTPRIECA